MDNTPARGRTTATTSQWTLTEGGCQLVARKHYGFSKLEGIYYARSTDDFFILTQTRWQLSRCIAQLNDSLDVSGFEPHPDKTYFGRMARGFDWLGAWFEPGSAGLAPR
ncbi:hypothetical protein PUT37_001916 [Salmonella enterica]|nr:hypothetical protein [Salmonella enterica]